MTKYIHLKIKSRSLLIVEHNSLSYIGIDGLNAVQTIFQTINAIYMYIQRHVISPVLTNS